MRERLEFTYTVDGRTETVATIAAEHWDKQPRLARYTDVIKCALENFSDESTTPGAQAVGRGDE